MSFLQQSICAASRAKPGRVAAVCSRLLTAWLLAGWGSAGPATAAAAGLADGGATAAIAATLQAVVLDSGLSAEVQFK